MASLARQRPGPPRGREVVDLHVRQVGFVDLQLDARTAAVLEADEPKAQGRADDESLRPVLEDIRRINANLTPLVVAGRSSLPSSISIITSPAAT